LGGEWREGCFAVERRWAPSDAYGRETVGEIASALEDGQCVAPLLAGVEPVRRPFVFFDLETTGLSGGAGTHAFLVGCGWFEHDGHFVTRQFLLTRFADERALLKAVASDLAQAGALVTFNGKSFDAPVLETRYLFHRLQWAAEGLAHVDILHPARRFWKPGIDGVSDAGGCSLIALERRILGATRVGDVPGFEIPSRYFTFLRGGDPRPLAAVLEHNRLDLLSLAGLTARLLRLIAGGPGDVTDASEALALGRVYERAVGNRDFARVLDAYERAASMADRRSLIRCEALYALAAALRRVRRFDEAAIQWERLASESTCPSALRRDALQALAVHHEHRARDLARAKAFALRSLQGEQSPAVKEAGLHRLSRIERKLKGGKGANGAAGAIERQPALPSWLS
jgi:uncharacterized protein YprB with RNaseH-like and TPR domain